MGTHLTVLSESYPMYTNMTGTQGLNVFQKSLLPCSKVASGLEELNSK